MSRHGSGGIQAHFAHPCRSRPAKRSTFGPAHAAAGSHAGAPAASRLVAAWVDSRRRELEANYAVERIAARRISSGMPDFARMRAEIRPSASGSMRSSITASKSSLTRRSVGPLATREIPAQIVATIEARRASSTSRTRAAVSCYCAGWLDLS